MGITPMAITDRIRTMATIMGHRTIGTAGIATTTATTVIIIITTDTKLTQKPKHPLSWLGRDSEPALFLGNGW
jgi:hypothetical protein